MSKSIRIQTISFVVPCFNEGEVIDEFYRRAARVADQHPAYHFEFLFVNDGSTDATTEKLNRLAELDSRVKVLHFARNRGHQMALTAGTDFAQGDLVVTLDADLQDPPELLSRILGAVEDGADVVHMQRCSRSGESWFKLQSARLFYGLMGRLTQGHVIPECGDFRAVTRPALQAVRGFREHHKFLRGTYALLGFRQAILRYDRDTRYAGETKYPLLSMLRLAADGVFSFSSSPLYTIMLLSLLSWMTSLLYLTKALYEHFVLKITVPGWTSVIILMTFFTGILLFALGIVASYVGRIFEQGQQRPAYWLYAVRNIDLSLCDTSIPEVRLASAILASEQPREEEGEA